MIYICGGVRSTFELANHLEDRGHEVSVVAPLVPNSDKWFHPRKLANNAIETILNIKNGNDIKWFDLKATLKRPLNLSERWIPDGDVIVATNWINAFHINEYGPDKGEKFYFVRHYETWDGNPELVYKSYNLPLHKIVTSNWLKKIIEAEHSETPFYGPIPNGVNLNLFYRQKIDFNRSEPFRIGMMYRTQEFKCINDGLKALKIVKDRYPNVEIVLFGERILNNKLNDLIYLGDYEYHLLPVKDKLRKIYNSLDIFLFSSCSEGFGNPPMEAMACGTAVVSTDVGAISDYSLEGKTILTSPKSNPKALAENVIKLIENENLRQKIAKNGYEHIKTFNWENSAKKLEIIFEKFVPKKS